MTTSSESYQVGVFGILTTLGIVWLIFKVIGNFWSGGSGVKTTLLNGPRNASFIFGLYKYIQEAEDAGAIYEAWAAEYGSAFRLPGAFGSSSVVICNPEANAHFYSKETFVYVQTKLARTFIKNLFGRGLLWAEGESHKRQRKALSPAFSNVAIRKLMHVFYDGSYKLKASWDGILDSGPDDALIDVQKWMNRISLDSIGIAGFGHDFEALSGKTSAVVEAFNSFGSGETSQLSQLVFFMGPVFPILQKLPTKRNRIFRKLHLALQEIAFELLERSRREKEANISSEKSEEKSIIGQLIKAESTNSSLGMSTEEILAQMNVLLLAGYETTSISLTWALIELSRKQDKQHKLREELSKLGTDPSWEQLATDLPYLDAVVHEVLRLHPPIMQTTRVAAEDDILPLSTPVTTKSGETVSSLVIAKGTVIISPGRCINRCEAFWGSNAKEFEPERWLEDMPVKATSIPGHRHILTFSDGPRICLGRSFALTEFKAVLSVLIRNYIFELPDGPLTKIEKHRSILPRPRISGQIGPKVPLRVRKAE